MVKFFRSAIEPDKYLIFDVESGSLHIVDSVAFYIAKKRYNALEKDEEHFLDNIPQKEVDTYYQEEAPHRMYIGEVLKVIK